MATMNLRVELKDLKTGKPITSIIKINDGVAIAIFSDKNFAKRLYEYEVIRASDKKVFYDGKENAYIEQYPNMNSSQIFDKISREIRKQGGKLLPSKPSK